MVAERVLARWRAALRTWREAVVVHSAWRRAGHGTGATERQRIVAAARDLVAAVRELPIDPRHVARLEREARPRASRIGAGDEVAPFEWPALDEVLDDVAVLGAAPARAALDVDRDPDCGVLRAILADGPKMLGAIERDRRCRVARRRASALLRAMQGEGIVRQTRPRGPWALVDEG